jgi:hypothetical protein
MSMGRNYRVLWAGSTAANFGDGISYVAMPLLAAALTNAPYAYCRITDGLLRCQILGRSAYRRIRRSLQPENDIVDG